MKFREYIHDPLDFANENYEEDALQELGFETLALLNSIEVHVDWDENLSDELFLNDLDYEEDFVYGY